MTLIGCRVRIPALLVLGSAITNMALAQQPEQVPFQQVEQIPIDQPVQESQPQSAKQGLRQLFAGTLATVLQGVGAAATAGLAQGLSGATPTIAGMEDQTLRASSAKPGVA